MITLFRRIQGKTVVVLALYLIVGVLIRSVLAFTYYRSAVNPDMLGADSLSYAETAKEILHGKIVTDCCAKNAGYSVFLAIVYLFFGVDNQMAVRVIQLLLELLTALLIYFTAKRIFSPGAALWAFILYCVNPFTSSFTVIILAEVVTIFYIAVICYLITLPSYISRKVLWFGVGLMLGLLVFTRHSFVLLSFVFFFILMLRQPSTRRRLLYMGISVAGFFIMSAYSLAGNYINYQKITIVPPVGLIPEILYTDFYLFRYPELHLETKGVDPVYLDTVLGYWETPLKEKPAHSRKYMKLFLEKLKTDWPVFLRNMLVNEVWMWDKEHLFVYSDPLNPADTTPIRILNIVFLLLYFIGLISEIIRKKLQVFRSPILMFTLTMFLYMVI